MLKEYFTLEKYEEIKASNNMIYKALEIVTNLFDRDVDKGGNAYILHILYVYNKVNSEHEKVVALLHDVMEDKGVTSEDLLDVGFPESVVSDVLILTRKRPIEYNDYIDNIINSGSVSALHVKLADVTHNMDLSRIAKPTVKDFERLERRYAPTYEKINNKLGELNR